MNAYKVGLDIGSTTAKMVVLDKDGTTVLFSGYKRHQAKIQECLLGFLLQSPNQKIPDRKTKCVIKTHINIKQNVIFGAKLKPV